MPRFFFNLRYGPDKLSINPEGDEIGDQDLARQHALHVARQMVRTQAHAVRHWMTCSFEVTDEHHRPVFQLAFADLVAENGSPGPASTS